jgi:HK97 family phage major capsid protein
VPSTIYGYQYQVNQDMAVPAHSAKAVLFGDLSKFLVRRVGGTSIFRFNEKYMDSLNVAFMAWERVDSDLLDAGTHPIAILENA